MEKTPQELVDSLEELKREVRRSKFYDFFLTELQLQLDKHSTKSFGDIQCLALGKPAEDEGVRYQLVLLLLLAEELKIPLDKVVCTEPMFTERDTEMLELLGMKVVKGLWEKDGSSASGGQNGEISTEKNEKGDFEAEKDVSQTKEADNDTQEGQNTPTSDPDVSELSSSLSKVTLSCPSFIYAPHAPVNVNELLFVNADFIVANYLGSYDVRFGDQEFKDKYPVLSDILESEKNGKCHWDMVEVPDKLSKGEAWAVAYNGFGIHRKKPVEK